MKSHLIPSFCSCCTVDLLYSLNSCLRTLSAFVRFPPLSLTKCLVPGRLAEKQEIACKRESASLLCTNSTWTDLVLIHAKTIAHTLWMALDPWNFTSKGPIISSPTDWKGGGWSQSYLGQNVHLLFHWLLESPYTIMAFCDHRSAFLSTMYYPYTFLP